MLGVYFARGDQHFDHRSIQDHVGSLTASDLLYKGVLTGRARTIYSGNVIIEPGAHRCDAYQTNRNILLSEEAKADSIPNLEILFSTGAGTDQFDFAAIPPHCRWCAWWSPASCRAWSST